MTLDDKTNRRLDRLSYVCLAVFIGCLGYVLFTSIGEPETENVASVKTYPQPQLILGINYHVVSWNRTISGYDYGKIINVKTDGITYIVTLENGIQYHISANLGVDLDNPKIIGQAVKIIHNEYDDGDCIISSVLLQNQTTLKLKNNEDLGDFAVKNNLMVGLELHTIDLNGNIDHINYQGGPYTVVDDFACPHGSYDEIDYK